jgi:hypothetical protein
MPNYLALISLSNLWKAALYVVGVVLFVLLSLELLLRLTFPDPSYYWPFRFWYISPHAFQKQTEAVWTYQPNMSIREVAVYGVPSLFRERPRMIIEYDCMMKSNNLGFLQERDIGTDEMSRSSSVTASRRAKAAARGSIAFRRVGRTIPS